MIIAIHNQINTFNHKSTSTYAWGAWDATSLSHRCIKLGDNNANFTSSGIASVNVIPGHKAITRIPVKFVW